MDTKELISLIGLFIGIAGFLIGMSRYEKAQKWKKAEFAAQQLEKLSNDPVLELATIMLDWEGRKVTIPDKYKHFTEEYTFVHSWAHMKKAMVGSLVPENGQYDFDWQDVLYRDTFDYFFSYLERIDHFIDSNLISTEDVKPIEYWLEQINKSKFNNDSVFSEYIKYFEYTGVNDLMKKFAVR